MAFRFLPGEIVTFFFEDGTPIKARVMYSVVGSDGKLTADFYTPEGEHLCPVNGSSSIYTVGETGRRVHLPVPS